MNKIAIIGGKRIPFARSVSSYKEVGNFELLTATLRSLKEKYKLDSFPIGEVCAGAVLKRSKDFSLARETLLEAGLSPQTPGIDIQKACGTSLEAAFIIGAKIATGQIECGIAAGTDTSSDVPIELSVGLSRKLVMASKEKDFLGKARTLAQLSPKDILPKIPAVKEPRTGLTMGEHCELMAQEWGIARKEQDELAYQSHRRAAAAYETGFFADLVTPFLGLEKDNNLRPDTELTALAKLRPCFEKSEKGTLTAGNSTPLTDGASALFMCSEDFARKHGLEIECYLTYCESKAVDYRKDEGLLMAPAYTIPIMLERAKLKLQDFDFYEIHEAFAAQVLCTLKAWQDPKFCKTKLNLPTILGDIDRAKLNVKGGSIALGHPFAATGTRLLATASKLLREKGQGRALLSICTAGGMGVSAILERP